MALVPVVSQATPSQNTMACHQRSLPLGVPDGELAEGLMATDHGSLDRPARHLAEIGGQDIEDEPADVGKQAAVMSEEGA
jgi:hypothetical protein